MYYFPVRYLTNRGCSVDVLGFYFVRDKYVDVLILLEHNLILLK